MTKPQVDGRVARRLTGMRRVQEVALELFERQGFDAVTVEDVARAAGVGTASVFRNFQTKEQLLLWDEYDPLLFDAVSETLATHAPLQALQRAVGAALGTFYARDRARLLRRTRLVLAHEGLRAASRAGIASVSEGLEQLLGPRLPDALERAVVIGTFTAVLDAAILEWHRLDGRRSLSELLELGFAHVSRNAALRPPVRAPSGRSQSTRGAAARPKPKAAAPPRRRAPR